MRKWICWKGTWLVISVLALLALAVPVAAQTSPCAGSLTTGVLNPTKIYVTSSDFMVKEIDDSYRVQALVVSFYLQGATQPVQSPTVMDRSVWTLQTGTTDCVGATLPAVPLAAGSGYFATVVERGVLGDSAPSPQSNPFGVGAKPGGATKAVVGR